jgi:truncated hemoglobin YjbI
LKSRTAASQRALAGRIGGYRLAATHDSREMTRAGRAAFLTSFYTAVDPDGSLPPAERERRATAARSAHFAAMAYRSSRSRGSRPASAVHDRSGAR